MISRHQTRKEAGLCTIGYRKCTNQRLPNQLVCAACKDQYGAYRKQFLRRFQKQTRIIYADLDLLYAVAEWALNKVTPDDLIAIQDVLDRIKYK